MDDSYYVAYITNGDEGDRCVQIGFFFLNIYFIF